MFYLVNEPKLSQNSIQNIVVHTSEYVLHVWEIVPFLVIFQIDVTMFDNFVH